MSSNLAHNCKIVRCSNAVAAGTTTVNGTGVDTAGYEGVLFVLQLGALTATNVTTLKAQGSSDDGSADAYADMAGASAVAADTESGKILYLDVADPREKWVRPVVTRATANAVIESIIAILYGPKSMPTAQNATGTSGGTVIRNV